MVDYIAAKAVDLHKDWALTDLAQGQLTSGKRFWALMLIPADREIAAGIEILPSIMPSDIAKAFVTLAEAAPFVRTVLVDHANPWHANTFVSVALSRGISLTYIPRSRSLHHGRAGRFIGNYQREVIERLAFTTINAVRSATAAWLVQR